MGCFTLNQHTFLENISAATTTADYPCDWKYSGVQQRIIDATMVTADTITIQGTMDAGATYYTVTAQTGAVGATRFTCIVNGPHQRLRVVKTGTTGAATVKGLV
jgi:hypothetical protein